MANDDPKRHPNKRLGQHFLRDKKDYARIISRHADLPCPYPVLEVGPGPGGLTKAILDSGQTKLVVVEKDQRFQIGLQALAAQYTNSDVKIVPGDILKENALLENGYGGQPWRIIANLPYYISSPFLIQLCGHSKHIESALIMLQKDLADRLIAEVGCAAYGRLSVIIQSHFKVKRVEHFSAGRFIPPPKVDSTLVKLCPCDEPPDAGLREKISEITEHAFRERRKMLRNSLSRHPDNILDDFEMLGLKTTARAETVSVADYRTLATLALKRGGR